jgi:hypothetical protein
VDGTGSGSCPVAGFGISGVEPSGSVTTESVNQSAGVYVRCEVTKREYGMILVLQTA